MIYFFLGLIIVLILAGIAILVFHKKKKLSLEACSLGCQKIKNTQNLDPAHAILESHKIFVSTIKGMFSPDTGDMTAAEILSQVSGCFKNEHEIWQFHRLRNQIAHQMDVPVSYEDSQAARLAFIRALRDLV
ncbi:hypothetical protein K9L27_03210 [Candidatus Gracilibacteria bacterium]|nr:hypothetical protein [Candidatus Gracilibacteria bacterium]